MSPVCDQCILRSQNILSFNPIRLEGGVQGEALQVGAKLCLAPAHPSIFVIGFRASISACIIETRFDRVCESSRGKAFCRERRAVPLHAG